MNRPPKVDVEKMIPAGLRVLRQAWGEDLKIQGYPRASIRSFQLAKDVNLIVSELGTEYLNDLRRTRDQSDVYANWAESPLDVEKLKEITPENSLLLDSIIEKCSPLKDRHHPCWAFMRSMQNKGVFYTYGKNIFIYLNSDSNDLYIAYMGPYAKRR